MLTHFSKGLPFAKPLPEFLVLWCALQRHQSRHVCILCIYIYIYLDVYIWNIYIIYVTPVRQALQLPTAENQSGRTSKGSKQWIPLECAIWSLQCKDIILTQFWWLGASSTHSVQSASPWTLASQDYQSRCSIWHISWWFESPQSINLLSFSADFFVNVVASP